MTDHITSDLHFYHNSILKFNANTRKHLGETVDEMNKSLIDEWNSKVRPNDTIYHLGDFLIGNPGKMVDILEQLNGKKIFILGNHDLDHKKKEPILALYGETKHYDEIKLNKQRAILFHYPIASWRNIHRGSLMFHGHCHGFFKVPGRILDVGYDAHGKILRLEEAFEIALSKEIYTGADNLHTQETEERRNNQCL